MYGKLTKKYDVWSAWDTRLDTEIKFFEKLFKDNNLKTKDKPTIIFLKEP